mmetsp:Transcript_56510/g.162164  ORF Transcript_56510/g.162164 Transcript_56510/m.162164 type:complete len:370 (-) Transcript_56510:320-1429(-)
MVGHLLLGAAVEQAVEDDGVRSDTFVAHELEQIPSLVHLSADAVALDKGAVSDEVGYALSSRHVTVQPCSRRHVPDAAASIDQGVEYHKAHLGAVLAHLVVAGEGLAALLSLRKAADEHRVGHGEALRAKALPAVRGLHVLEHAQGVLHAGVADEHINHLAEELLRRWLALLPGGLAPKLPGHVELPGHAVGLDQRGVGVHGALLGEGPSAPAEGSERSVEALLVPQAEARLQGHVHEDLVGLDRILLDERQGPVEGGRVDGAAAALVALEEDADRVRVNAWPSLHLVHSAPCRREVACGQYATQQRVVSGNVRLETKAAHLLEQGPALFQASVRPRELLQQNIVSHHVHAMAGLHLLEDGVNGLLVAV